MAKPPARRTTTKRPLPPPTASERAFERALALLRQAPDDGDRDTSVILSLSKESATGIDAFVEAAFAKGREYLTDRYSSIGGASAFHTKLAGVSFEGRQDVIAGLRVGFELDLIRQPDNQYDANAIAVHYGALQLG
ncbi:MAG TPA: hypothetical protein VGN11_08750, partial [Candidatus Baltobacteraceae bacterium]|nr:hypothetical protein [Candidatus Baltobacteraceae bacterium]